MDSLTTAASLKPNTTEKLYRLKEFYLSDVKGKDSQLSAKVAEKLLALLLSLAGEEEETTAFRKDLSKVAHVSMELFYFFLLEDDEFQDAVERKEATFLSGRLKFKLHLKDEDEEHVKLTKDVILFLSKNYQKFAGWLDEKTADVKENPALEVARLSQDGRLPPEGMYYDTAPDLVANIFRTDMKMGLLPHEVTQRRARYGENKLPEAPPVSPIKMLWTQLTDFMVLILLAVAVISFALQDWIEGVVLVLVVVTNVAIGFVQEYRAEQALQALKLMAVQVATVIRNNEQEDINAAELVPGDIVLLEEGDTVPADLRMFESINLQILESVLTGESVPVTKTVEAISKPDLTVGDRTNMAFMHTTVLKGRGKGIVVSSGAKTEVGQISKALTKPQTKRTLLQMRLTKLGKVLVAISVVLCALLVGIGFLRTYLKNDEITGQDVEIWVKVGISLAVSVIPEGLVAVTTVTMALGIQRMASKNAVVRKLPAVETIGSITTICSDKTGTLTEGKMKLEEVWAGNQTYKVTGSGTEPTGSFFHLKKEVPSDKIPKPLRHMLMICSLCNNAAIQKDRETGEWTSVGDPTEVALVVGAEKLNMGKSYWTEMMLYEFSNEVAFDSDRRRMSVTYKEPDGSMWILVKGAPETILDVCTNSLGKDMKTREIGSKRLKKIEEKNAKMASKGLRVLAFGLKELDPEEAKEMEKADPVTAEKDLTFVGLVGLIDPPREQVKPTIKQCRDAGIRVCMITGDHQQTAFAIGAQLGIIDRDREDMVVTGSQLDAMSKGDLAAMDPFPTVFARVSPANKLKIVNALQLNDEICAMTGDGVNDAPAIKNADVGIAMGKTATDLTRDSASIILTDDNFNTIIAAVKEGRRTYDNIRKFVMYLLACNSAEIYLMLIAVIVGIPVPFTPIMILWANLIADIPPALALGADHPETDILDRLPRDPRQGIFTLGTAMMIFFYGGSMALVTLILYVIAIYVEDIEIDEDPNVPGPARNLAFVGLTCMQLIHSFLARSFSQSAFNREIFSNRWLIAGVLLSLVLLVAGCYIPGLNDVLNQWPLDWWAWVKIIIAVMFHILIVEGAKYLFGKLLIRRRRIQEKKGVSVMFYQDV